MPICVKIPYGTAEDSFFLSEPFTKWQAWVDLLLLASEGYDGGGVGYVSMSLPSLSGRWRWSVNKVVRFIERLIVMGKIRKETSNRTTKICVLGFASYLVNGYADGYANGYAKNDCNELENNELQAQKKSDEYANEYADEYANGYAKIPQNGKHLKINDLTKTEGEKQGNGEKTDGYANGYAKNDCNELENNELQAQKKSDEYANEYAGASEPFKGLKENEEREEKKRTKRKEDKEEEKIAEIPNKRVREERFYERVKEIGLGKYTNQMLRDFFDYWTESNDGERAKMRFEKEATFDVSRRLARWDKFSKTRYNNGNGQQQNNNNESANDRIDRILRNATATIYFGDF